MGCASYIRCALSIEKYGILYYIIFIILYHIIQCVPLATETRHFFNNFATNEDIATKFEADLPHCVRISHTTNALLFKSRCNIFIGFGIIKELPGLVGSGTLYIRSDVSGELAAFIIKVQMDSK